MECIWNAQAHARTRTRARESTDRQAGERAGETEREREETSVAGSSRAGTSRQAHHGDADACCNLALLHECLTDVGAYHSMRRTRAHKGGRERADARDKDARAKCAR